MGSDCSFGLFSRPSAKIQRGSVGIRHRLHVAADAAAARCPRLSAWGIFRRPSQGREHGPSGSGVMRLKRIMGIVAISRRFTANGLLFHRVPHAEAWGTALGSLRERAWRPQFDYCTADKDGVADVRNSRGSVVSPEPPRRQGFVGAFASSPHLRRIFTPPGISLRLER